MKLKMTYKHALLATLFASPILAHAETGFYLGGGIGGSNFSGDIGHQIRTAYQGFPSAVVTSAELSDNSDTAYKLFGGYHFLPWLALEVSWVDLGEAKSFYQTTQLTSHPDITGRYRLHGVSAALAAEYPLTDRFAVTARAGLLASRLKYDESGPVNLETTGSDLTHHFSANTESQTRPMIGLGFSFTPASRWEFRLDWDRYLGIGTRFDLSADQNGRFDHVDQYTINAMYHFGE